MTLQQKDELIVTMSESLHMLRARLDLTQDELANMIGVTRQTYMGFENCQRKMQWGTFLSLLMIFTKNKETDKILNVIGIYTDELNDFLKRR